MEENYSYIDVTSDKEANCSSWYSDVYRIAVES